MEWYDLAAELEPLLRKDALETCISRVRSELMALPESPFHIAADLKFTNSPKEVAEYFEELIEIESEHYPIQAIYTETNGFDINPDRWYLDAFTYKTYGGLEDFDWLAYWDSDDYRQLTLNGMYKLQKVYDSDAFWKNKFDKASGLSSLLVVLQAQALIKRSAELIEGLSCPLLVTAHDYDFIYEYRPKKA
jgi:hypothetical protein